MVLGEHRLRKVDTNQIFCANRSDGDGKYQLALFDDPFHWSLTFKLTVQRASLFRKTSNAKRNRRDWRPVYHMDGGFRSRLA
jgi:hypothetical protein